MQACARSSVHAAWQLGAESTIDNRRLCADSVYRWHVLLLPGVSSPDLYLAVLYGSLSALSAKTCKCVHSQDVHAMTSMHGTYASVPTTLACVLPHRVFSCVSMKHFV